MSKEIATFESIMRDIKNRNYSPVYLLMGDESYYIDKLSEYIENSVLTDDEKEFNLNVLYGADVSIDELINVSKRYPMMSQYQVVIVKEAQSLSKIEELVHYVQKPLQSTILVICYKHGSIDKRKKIVSEVEKNKFVLFESNKIRDEHLPTFITSYLQKKQVVIDRKSSEMIAEFVGNDLSRLCGELDKLIITLTSERKVVTPEHIEKNIGISKDYNVFELKSALINKDVLKSNKIINYFEKNPKSNPIQQTLPLLFHFFSNLMLAYYAPDKTEQGIATMLGLRSSYQSKDYITAMRNFTGIKTMQIIGHLRYADALSKGVRGSSTDAEIMKELVFKILH